MNHLVIGMILLYKRLLSPLMGPRCRFYPSCSSYCLEAFQKFGFWKAAKMSVIRISKCHPFHPGGVDPIKGAK